MRLFVSIGSSTNCTLFVIHIRKVIIELAESFHPLTTRVVVFLPLHKGRTNHPWFPEVLALGFSPALVLPRVGSSKFRDGWPLASLSC